jgi:hypothetical protein
VAETTLTLVHSEIVDLSCRAKILTGVRFTAAILRFTSILRGMRNALDLLPAVLT